MLDVQNHSIFAMVESSGIVVQSVLILLIFLSIWSWTITIAKFLQFKKIKEQSREFSTIFWETKNFTKVEEACSRLFASPLAQVFTQGYKELSAQIQEAKDSNESLSENKDGKIGMLETALKRAEYQESLRLERGLTFLASVASAAPFIGLFGTVWGIMNAFNGLSTSQNSTIQAVAPGISEALVATAIGLAAAIPAAVAYNYYAVAVKNSRDAMNKFSDEFISIAKRYFVK